MRNATVEDSSEQDDQDDHGVPHTQTDDHLDHLDHLACARGDSADAHNKEETLQSIAPPVLARTMITLLMGKGRPSKMII
jgi:hypothetical protein